jgi:hypothetical protein
MNSKLTKMIEYQLLRKVFVEKECAGKFLPSATPSVSATPVR